MLNYFLKVHLQQTSEFPCSGTCVGVVVNTGDNTVMGRIARLTGSIKEESQ